MDNVWPRLEHYEWVSGVQWRDDVQSVVPMVDKVWLQRVVPTQPPRIPLPTPTPPSPDPANFYVHCFLCLKRAKMNPSPDPTDPADPPDPADPVHGLPIGTSPTRAGGQDDVSSQANSLK